MVVTGWKSPTDRGARSASLSTILTFIRQVSEYGFGIGIWEGRLAPRRQFRLLAGGEKAEPPASTEPVAEGSVPYFSGE